ncbi:hypothetical protein [Streptomyces sp. NPDC014995]|uniref:hypothetical protein n=1 Tax=Streptomyces sp. NPDC014995 TaxID=3364936 RepID=UPI0036FECBDF
MLLVLDDAADHTQVEPLLPGMAGSLVLITSRRRLIALDGAEPLPLGTLSSQEAELHFTRLCGYLPLAIALLAGRLAHHPEWNLVEFANDFHRTQDRISELQGGDRAVAAAFEMSYRDLPSGHQRLFRRLGLHPGTDTDIYATAALAGISRAQARQGLEALYIDHLIQEPAPGRYRLHDLVREYTRTLATRNDPDCERQESMHRLLDYYQHTAETADGQLSDSLRPGNVLWRLTGKYSAAAAAAESNAQYLWIGLTEGGVPSRWIDR